MNELKKCRRVLIWLKHEKFKLRLNESSHLFANKLSKGQKFFRFPLFGDNNFVAKDR